MNNKKNQHVVPSSTKKWAVKGAGNKKNTKLTLTKEEAVNMARQIAKNK